MAYPLNDSFKEAMGKATVYPVVHCSIALSAITYEFHNCSDPDMESTITGDPVLSDVTAVSATVDPITRSTQTAEMNFNVYDDGRIRQLATAGKKFQGKIMTVKLGASDLALTHFENIFSGPITQVSPVEGGFSIKVRAFVHSTEGVKSFRSYVDTHPFTALRQMLVDAGISTGNLDTASFLPANHTDISHYTFGTFVFYNTTDGSIPPVLQGAVDPEVETNGVDRGQQEVNITEYIDECMRLTRSTLVTDPGTNKVKIVRYDESSSVTKHFTVDEYTDFEQEAAGLEIITEVKTCFGKLSSVDGLIQKDSTAITNYGSHDMSHTVNYISAATVHLHDQLSGSSTAFKGFAADSPICGTRDLHLGGGTQPADAKLSADRPYFGLYRTEILKSITPFSAADLTGNYVMRDHEGDPDGTEEASQLLFLTTLVSRPFAGTEAEGVEATAAGVTTVADITAAFQYGEYVLKRFSNTCPKIKFSTTLEHMNVEIGDLVSLDNDLFCSTELGIDGLDSDVKFEVIKREINPLGDSIGINFELAYATHSSAVTVTVTSRPPGIVDSPRQVAKGGFIASRAAATNASVMDAKTTTMAVTATSGLGISIAAGAVQGSGVTRESDAAITTNVTANKDTYIGMSLFTGAIIKNEVSTSAAEPELIPGEVRLAKVVAASSVSSVTDLRNFGTISVEQMDKIAFEPGRKLSWNPGFDIYPNSGAMPPGWELSLGTAGTDFTKDATVYSGRHSIKTLGTGNIVLIYSEKIPVDKNRAYRISGMYQQSAAETVRLVVYWWDANRAQASTQKNTIHNGNLSSTGAWIPLSGVFTPPSDAAFASVQMYSTNGSGNTTLFNNADIQVEPFSFAAKRTSSDFTPSGSGDTVEFNTEIHDHGDVYRTTTGVFTCPASGTYTFNATLSIEGAVGIRDLNPKIVASTAGTIASIQLADSANGTDEWNDVIAPLNVSAVDLVKGETVEVQIAYTGTAPPVRSNYSFFSGREVY